MGRDGYHGARKCGHQLVVVAGIIGGELGDQPSRGDQLARVPRTDLLGDGAQMFLDNVTRKVVERALVDYADEAAEVG